MPEEIVVKRSIWISWTALRLLALGCVTSGCALLHLGEPPPPPEVEQLTESAAAARAVKTSLDYFLDQLRRKKGEKFLVRATFLGTEDDSEVLWLTNVSVRGRFIRGKLAQTPTMIAGAKKGAVIECPVTDVVDWIIVRNGKTYGGYTEHPKF